MVNIRKPFDVVETSSLKPGDLITGIVEGVKSFGIMLAVEKSPGYVVIMDTKLDESSIRVGRATLFGSSHVAKISGEWSLVSNQEAYTTNESYGKDFHLPGRLAIAHDKQTLAVLDKQGDYQYRRIDLATLGLAKGDPGSCVIVRKWEIWLNADIGTYGGEPLYSFSAEQPGERQGVE